MHGASNRYRHSRLLFIHSFALEEGPEACKSIMHKLFSLLALILGFSLTLTSCGGNDDDPEGSNSNPSGGEWFCSGFASPADFRTVNQAIDDHELLSTYRYGGSTKKHYAERDAFFQEYGWYSTDQAYWGRLRFVPDNQTAQIWHITDHGTIENYLVMLYPVEDRIGPTYHLVNAGNLGKLAYTTNIQPTVYSYIKNGDQYILNSGTVLIKSGNTLIKSGTSTSFKRFTPDF